jgi:hypothetical protein
MSIMSADTPTNKIVGNAVDVLIFAHKIIPLTNDDTTWKQTKVRDHRGAPNLEREHEK